MNEYEYRPSALTRLVACAGSHQAQRGEPEETSEDAEIGTAAHWVGSESLLGNGDPFDFIGQTAPNGIVITADMVEAVATYTDHVHSVIPANHQPITERTMDISRVDPRCGGTPDCWWFDQKTLTLHLWDFKHGRIPVSAYENWQGIAYLIGVLDLLTGGKALHEGDRTKCVFYIVQPNAVDHRPTVRMWRVNAVDLRPYLNKLQYQIAKSREDSPEFVTGPHCYKCLARGKCQADIGAVARAIEYTTQDHPATATPERIALELKLLRRCSKLIKERLELIEAQAETLPAVPGFNKLPRLGNRTWNAPDDEIISLAQMFGIDGESHKAITPAAFERQLKAAKLPLSAMDGLTYRPSRGVKLTEINPNEVFDNE